MILLPLLLSACLESLLEAPYILTAGLGPVHALSPSADQNVLAATDAGTVHLSGDGQPRLLDAVPARSVTTHRDRLYILSGEQLRWSTLPLAEPPSWQTRPAPEDTTDIQAWCGRRVLLATGSGLQLWDPDTDTIEPLPWGSGPVQRVTLPQADPCENIIVAAGDAIERRTAEGSTTLADGLQQLRAVTVSSTGQVWVISGSKPMLSLLTPAGPEVRARHLGDARDVIFGHGGLWAKGNAYLASGEGRVDYAQMYTSP